MTKRVIVLLLMVMAMVGCSASPSVEARVKVIRDAYAKAQERVKACAANVNDRNKFVVERLENVSGGGPTQYKAELFFINKNMANPDAMADYWVYFIRVSRVVEGKTEYKEFLYEEKGDLIFYYERMPNPSGKSSETRLYFDKKESIGLARVIIDGKTIDSPEMGEVELYVPDEDDKVKAVFDAMMKMNY